MQIIISPAKKMVEDRDSLAPRSVPQFLPQTRQLLKVLRAMSPQELQRLWSCNDAIARLNVQRLETMELEGDLTPAILSYQGIQYQYMAPGVLESQALDYLQTHLRILSGFYGVLRPFDGVTPYRLEMQAKLAERGTQCKMARGEMVRWLAQNQITRREDLPAFQGLGYRFDPSASTPTELIFYTEGE